MTTTEATYLTMTIEHLGQDADDEDLAEFQAICRDLRDLFESDQAVTDYVWNNGNIRWSATREDVASA